MDDTVVPLVSKLINCETRLIKDGMPQFLCNVGSRVKKTAIADDNGRDPIHLRQVHESVFHVHLETKDVFLKSDSV